MAVVAAASMVAARVDCPAQTSDYEDATVLLFSGRDIWRNGAFLYGGLLIAPGGFEQDGLLLKLIYSVGAYRYNAANLGGAQVIGGEILGSFLPGWRIKRGELETKIFFGPEFASHPLWPDDPANRLRGNAVGMRLAAEFWYEPTPATMVAGDLSLSTIAADNSGRIASGWRVMDDTLGGFYVGPEAQYFASDNYRHWRLGAHLTAMKIDNYEWSAAGGLARDSVGRSSPYLRLGFAARQ